MRDGVVARDAAGLLPATKEAKVSHSANDKWSGKATRLKMLCLLDCPRCQACATSTRGAHYHDSIKKIRHRTPPAKRCMADCLNQQFLCWYMVTARLATSEPSVQIHIKAMPTLSNIFSKIRQAAGMSQSSGHVLK